jgi:DNA invertase Pin-like site-specific DNA recombinase
MTPRRRARAVEGTPSRGVLYVRVSALMGRHGDNFHSPELQVDAMRRLVTPAGLKEVAVIQDIDVSGRSFSREGLDEIRRLVENRHVDVVAVYDLSRLGRNATEALTFIKWLRDHGVSIISTVEQITDSPEGRFMLGQFLGMAELWSNQIGRRWSEIIARRASDQGLPHAHAPIGYRRAGRMTEPDPDLAPAVTEVFARYAAGDPVGDIAQFLTARRGIRVPRELVKRMMRNRVYLGEVQSHGRWYPGKHEPLTDAETWQRVQVRLERDATTPARVVAPKYAMTGLMFCTHCKLRLKIWPAKRRDIVVVRARCRWVMELGVASCPGPGTPRLDDIERITLDRLRFYIADLRDDLTVRTAQAAAARAAATDLVKARDALAETRAAMGRLAENWARSRTPATAYQQAMANLERTEDAQQLLVVGLESAAMRPAPAVFVGLGDELFRMWPQMTAPQRNRALRGVISHVWVRGRAFRGESLEDRIQVVFR